MTNNVSAWVAPAYTPSCVPATPATDVHATDGAQLHIVAYWEDGDWCWENDLPACLQEAGKSDDYALLTVHCPDGADNDDIAENAVAGVLASWAALYKEEILHERQ